MPNIGNSTSRLNSLFLNRNYIPKNNINMLLNYFNELDSSDQGFINKKLAKIFFRSIQIDKSQINQIQFQQNYYSFDHLLSILGRLQCPQESSIYIIQFLKVLINFRNKCLEKQIYNQQQQNQKLLQAKQIDQRIKKIIYNQIQRQTAKIVLQNRILYAEMQENQNRQIQQFQEEWRAYLHQFQEKNVKRLQQKSLRKKNQLNQDQVKFIKSARRHSILTSTKLKELEQKKKRFVKQGNYNQALFLNEKIKQQKNRILQNQQQKTHYVVRKRYQSFQRKNQTIMHTTLMNMTVNMDKLIAKKKQGQNILKIRMKNIREETKKKMNQKLKQEINRLKSLFYQETKISFK